MKKIVILSLFFFFWGVFCKGQFYSSPAVPKNNEAVELLKRFPKQDDIKTAICLLEEAIALDSTFRLGYINLIQSMMRQGATEDALAMTDVAFRHSPYGSDDSDLYFLKGILLAKSHQRALSDTMFQKSIRLMEEKLTDAGRGLPVFFKKSVAKAFMGDKYIAYLDLLAAQFFLIDMSFHPYVWEIYHDELKFILNFDRNREVRTYWSSGEMVDKDKYVIDYE